MKRLALFLPVSLALFALLGAAQAGSPLHPDIPFLDDQGRDVLESGRPVSPMKTCGECHDTGYIENHSYHAAVGFDERFEPGSREGVRPWSFSPGRFGRWDPLHYRRLTIPGESAFDLGVADWIRIYGPRHAGGGPALHSRTGVLLRSLEATVEVDPETYVQNPETGRPAPWDWKSSGGVEMDCFLCHVTDPADHERAAALRAGRFEWAPTATLLNTGLVRKREDGTYAWVRERFDEDGLVPQRVVRLGDPGDVNCGACHGQVHEDPSPVRLQLGIDSWETDSKGQIFSAQPVRDSALNLLEKDRWSHAWDVHAARLVGCTSCHTSLNNPVSFAEADRSRPRHLTYDARRPDPGAYLERPSHNFTKGESAQGTTARRLDGTMRRCEDCHDAVDVHAEWLPNPHRHLTVLLCETCHMPEVHAPARQQCDWTVLTPEREPRIVYRGVDGDPRDPKALVTGWEPVILPRHQMDGTIRHGPHNLCVGWYWVGGDPERPVRTHELHAAYLVEGGAYHPDVIAALDADGDGALAESELRLDTAEKRAAIEARLRAVGVENPRIEGCLQPLSLHHGVVPGSFATKRCETCHASDSRLTKPFELSSYVPYGAEAKLVGDSNIRMPGALTRDEQGRLLYVPVPTASGRYVIGHDRAGWIDVVGLLAILGSLVGVVVHASLRGHHRRRRRQEAS